MDNKYLIAIGVLVAGAIGVIVYKSNSATGTSSQSFALPARGSATLANFDDLAKAYPAVSTQFVYLLTQSANIQKASAANRTPDMQAKLDSIWAWNSNKI
jgi:hypothetical protein